MPRNSRVAQPGFAYHVLNRAVGRARLFRSKKDHAAFVHVLQEAGERFGTPLLAWCVMPNHWHLVLWPQKVGELSEFMRWLTVTHTQRWHAAHRTAGTGPLYQGRFKSFPIEEDDHLLTVLRYVERNALRADLVRRAEEWPWSSLPNRSGAEPGEGPVALPKSWVSFVNRTETKAELERLRRSVIRGAPFGDVEWQRRTADQLGLQSILKPRGRPRLRPEPEPQNDSRPLYFPLYLPCRGLTASPLHSVPVPEVNPRLKDLLKWSERRVDELEDANQCPIAAVCANHQNGGTDAERICRKQHHK